MVCVYVSMCVCMCARMGVCGVCVGGGGWGVQVTTVPQLEVYSVLDLSCHIYKYKTIYNIKTQYTHGNGKCLA